LSWELKDEPAEAKWKNESREIKYLQALYYLSKTLLLGVCQIVLSNLIMDGCEYFYFRKIIMRNR